MDRDQLLNLFQPFSLPCSTKPTVQDGIIQNVWDSVLNIVFQDTKLYFSMFPYLVDFSKQVTKFTESNPSLVHEKIEKLNPELPEEELISLIRSLYSILPFFTQQNITDIIEKSIAILKNYLNEKQDIPNDIIDGMNLAEVGLLSNQSLTDVYQTLRKYNNTENDSAAFILLQLFAQDIIDVEEEAEEEILKQSIDYLKKDKIHQLVALFMLPKLDGIIEEDSKLTNELFTALLPFFISKDEALFRVSHKSMLKLIKVGAFSEKLKVVEIIKQYSKYSPENIIHFFKFIIKYLDDIESVPMNVVQPIYDFLGLTAQAKDPTTRALVLETYAMLAAVNKDVLEETFEQELDVAAELLKTGNSLYLSKIGSYVLALGKTYPETFKRILDEFLPQLVDSLKNIGNSDDRKYKLDLAQSVAASVEGGNYPQFVSTIVEFTTKILPTISGSQILYIASIAIGLREQLTAEQATEIFEKVFEFALKTEVSSSLNVCLHVMKKILHLVKPDIVVGAADRILKGELFYSMKLTPNYIGDPKTMIFYFIAAVIKKIPAHAVSIAETVVSYVINTRTALLPALLEAVKASANVVKPETLKALYKNVNELMLHTNIKEEEEYCSVVDTMIVLVEKQPASVDGEEVIRTATKMLARCHGVKDEDEANENEEDEEEDDYDVVDNTEVLPTLSRLVFTVFLSKELNVEIKKDLIAGVLEDVPAESMNYVLPLILAMMREQDRFKTVLLPLAKTVVGLLFMQKRDLQELGLSDELIDEAKAAFKETCKKNTLIERQISKDYAKERPKLNKLKTLLK